MRPVGDVLEPGPGAGRRSRTAPPPRRGCSVRGVASLMVASLSMP